jgi:hypothetical protein
MAHALFALLLPLTLVSLGCGGNNDVQPPPPPPPVLSSEAGIADLSVSLGELAPSFAPSVKSYSVGSVDGLGNVGPVGYLGETSIGVTVTLKDAKATLRVNGQPAASGQRVDVAIREGANTIRVAVTAEDGIALELTTLALNRLPEPNSKVCVLNGISGVPIRNTVLKLTDNRGNVLFDNVPLPKEKNGTAFLSLDPAKKYNIYATGDDAAVACFANYDPAREDAANLYCLRTSSVYYEYEAPIIEEIAFATTNAESANWLTMSNDARYLGPLANVAAVRVTVLTANWIAGSFEALTGTAIPAPVRINVDEIASSSASGDDGSTRGGVTGTATGPTATPNVNVAVNVGGRQYYRSQYRFSTPNLSAVIFNKEHFLDVVAYDCLQNRTEQRVYLTITDAASSVAGDPDLSATVPTMLATQANTYVGAGDATARPGDEMLNGIGQIGTLSGYVQGQLLFYVRTPTGVHLGVRGYEVWRSDGDDKNFVKIATVNFASLTTGSPFVFNDRTPTLSEGVHYYRVRAFSGSPANNGYSPLSAPRVSNVMPPTTIVPAQSHKNVSDKVWPQFRIAASNPVMFNKDISDIFRFTLMVKNVTDQYPFLMVPFRVDFTQTETIAGVGGDDPAQQHRYGFPVGKPVVSAMWIRGYGNIGTATAPDYGIYLYTWYIASDSTTVDGDTSYKPFAYLDDDGSLVVDADSRTFQALIENAVRGLYDNFGEEFIPGRTYFWNVFGERGGIIWNTPGAPARIAGEISDIAYFQKGYNAAPTAGVPLSYSFTSNVIHGLGQADGWFTITIAPNAN